MFCLLEVWLGLVGEFSFGVFYVVVVGDSWVWGYFKGFIDMFDVWVRKIYIFGVRIVGVF